ncbi:hypothetical protein LTS18_002358, partial [Coniosporium uncinatum]
MDAFFELGGQRLLSDKAKFEALVDADDVRIDSGAENKKKDDKDRADDERKREEIEDRKWIAATGTLPPAGNRMAAQLLGFKLRFYASDAREKDDALPENLIYLAALLIKIGFISLRDLYPHLHPADDSMAEVKAKLEKDKIERERRARPGGGTNALMMAGALSDDSAPPPVVSRLRDAEAGRNTPVRGDATPGNDATPIKEE